MDSGNSGSLQSSSGGEEDYDSRNNPISAFISPSSAPVAPVSNPQPPQHKPNQPMFDPFSSNYFDDPNNNQYFDNNNLDDNMVFSKRPRSDSNNPFAPSSSSSLQPFSSNFTIHQTPQPGNTNTNGIIMPRASSSARNPKKRSRASRRAPTTVLTTDTANFRAMVQEFTGVPPPPFPTTRFDLFRAPSTVRSNPLDSLIRRPLPQRLEPFLSSSSSSMLSSFIADSTQQTANLFNMQNPILSSLLQSNPSIDEFVLGHGNVHSNNTTLGALPGLVSSDQTAPPRDDNNPAIWGGGAGSSQGDDRSQVMNRSVINGDL